MRVSTFGIRAKKVSTYPTKNFDLKIWKPCFWLKLTVLSTSADLMQWLLIPARSNLAEESHVILVQRQMAQSQLNFTQLELRSLYLVKRTVFGLFCEKTFTNIYFLDLILTALTLESTLTKINRRGRRVPVKARSRVVTSVRVKNEPKKALF